MPENITVSIKKHKADSLAHLSEIFSNEQNIGHLDISIDPKKISTHLMVVMYGMCVLAKNGSQLVDLTPVIDLTIKTILDPQSY